jgi:hypothetical protein
MTLPASGNSISLDQIHVELGESSGGTVALGDADVRALASDTDGAIAMNQFFGLSAAGAWLVVLTIDSGIAAVPSDAVYDVWGAASKSGDGIYILTSKFGMNQHNSDSSNVNPEFNITKINADGSVAWNKRIDGVADKIYNLSIHVALTSGADEIFCWWRSINGGTTGTDNRRRLLKLNASGVEQVEREYDVPAQSESIATHPQTSKIHDDGTYIYLFGNIAGNHISGAHGGSSGAWWSKIKKSDGEYTDEFMSGETSGSNWGRAVGFVDGSGNMLQTGSSTTAEKGLNFNKYASNKSKVFEKKYSYGGTSYPYVIQPYGASWVGGNMILATNNYRVSETGFTNGNYPALMKLQGSDGAVLFWVAAASAGVGFSFYGNVQDSSGNIYAIGRGIVSGDSKISAFVAKFNSSGVKQWNFALSYNDDSIHVFGAGIDMDASGNLYCLINMYGNSTQAAVLKIPEGQLGSAIGGLTAGQHGIYKITNTDFAFATVSGTITVADSATRLIGVVGNTDDASASDITVAAETGGGVTLVDIG